MRMTTYQAEKDQETFVTENLSKLSLFHDKKLRGLHSLFQKRMERVWLGYGRCPTTKNEAKEERVQGTLLHNLLRGRISPCH